MAEGRKVVRHWVVQNSLGLHARPASLFVKTANRFAAAIEVSKDGHVSDGKSVLGLLMLAAGQGAALEVTAQGEDATEALDALEELIARKFDED